MQGPASGPDFLLLFPPEDLPAAAVPLRSLWTIPRPDWQSEDRHDQDHPSHVPTNPQHPTDVDPSESALKDEPLVIEHRPKIDSEAFQALETRDIPSDADFQCDLNRSPHCWRGCLDERSPSVLHRPENRQRSE